MLLFWSEIWSSSVLQCDDELMGLLLLFIGPVAEDDKNEQWMGVSVVSQATDDGKALVSFLRTLCVMNCDWIISSLFVPWNPWLPIVTLQYTLTEIVNQRKAFIPQWSWGVFDGYVYGQMGNCWCYFLPVISQKLQNRPIWNLACKCSLIEGWCPYIFRIDLLSISCRLIQTKIHFYRFPLSCKLLAVRKSIKARRLDMLLLNCVSHCTRQWNGGRVIQQRIRHHVCKADVCMKLCWEPSYDQSHCL